MPRPRKYRKVRKEPNVDYYKPVGVPLREIEEVKLKVEEYEALRLKDCENIDQTEAAEKMNVSQPTFNRMLNSGREKVTDALVNGKAIRIEGGRYKFSNKGRRFRGGKS